MTTSALLPVQAAIFTALDPLSYPVYDYVENETELPYIIIGEIIEQPFNTFSRDGRELTAFIDAWSRGEGMKEIQAIAAAISTALDNVAIAVAGWSTTVYCQFKQAQTLREDNGMTRHLAMQFTVVVQV